MDKIIDTRSEKEIEKDDNWDEAYFKFMDYYEQFLEKVAKNSDLLICWNPLTNEEIICGDKEIDRFSEIVERMSHNTDLYIHLGKQRMKKYEYNELMSAGKCYARTPFCCFSITPKSENHIAYYIVNELYYMVIKPTIVRYLGKLVSGHLELTFYDEIEGSLYGDMDGFDDLLSGIVSKELAFSDEISVL